MKNKIFLTIAGVLMVGLFASVSVFATAGKMAPELAIFEPYLGTWHAEFERKPNQPKMVDVSKWERALNGKALRTLHSINDGMYGGESLIFWDTKTKQLTFYYFTTADFYTTGTLEILSNNSFAAYEDVTGESQLAQGIIKVRSTSQLLGDKMKVSTSYLKNGEWTPEESRTYTRSTKQVIFK